ncbi:DUF4139 domain-containing protein [Pseudomonas sp. GCM10022188]|uniref:DUF4139 domain-containing protein n=1 Tax=Pseudomonas TaxID=286 RepID=UPI001E6067CD|nr:DUF4139 domain-containing protein [Pseudomonas oryzagri]MCC6074588.1 DUF4139 domain-containing protein [Pseudomonas oryzagri]
MRLNATVVLLFPATLSSAVLAAPAPPITAVVLHPGSATVVRTAQVSPEMTEVVFSGLPARFDVQTLRAEAGPQVRVGQIVTQETAGATALNPAEAELEARILALQDQQAALDAEIASAELVKRYLERFSSGTGAEGEQQGLPSDPKVLAGLLAAIGQGASESLAKIQRLTVQKRELARQADVLQRDLGQLRSGVRDTRSVTVQLSAQRAGELRLSYQVANAGWRPAYRAALDTAASRLELERLATVAQKTGEDWSNVKLTLSTTQPRLSPAGPEPQPWVLTWQPPQPAQMSAMESKARANDMAAPAALAPAREAGSDETGYQPPTFANHGAFASEFVVPTPVSLPADGREVSVSLAQETLPAKHHLRIAPRLERAAVVTAEAERPEGVWLPGDTQLLRDGSYVGSAYWEPASAERFVFSFGRDEQLRVAVDQVEGQAGSTGVFDKRNERRVAEMFTLTNTHRQPVDVLLLESSPVSGSEEIKVRAVFDPAPTVQAWQQRRGVVAWERRLAAGESAKFAVDYRIEYPREGRVGGLE